MLHKINKKCWWFSHLLLAIMNFTPDADPDIWTLGIDLILNNRGGQYGDKTHPKFPSFVSVFCSVGCFFVPIGSSVREFNLKEL